jgi:hypothetical protein
MELLLNSHLKSQNIGTQYKEAMDMSQDKTKSQHALLLTQLFLRTKEHWLVAFVFVGECLSFHVVHIFLECTFEGSPRFGVLPDEPGLTT